MRFYKNTKKQWWKKQQQKTEKRTKQQKSAQREKNTFSFPGDEYTYIPCVRIFMDGVELVRNG